MDLRKDIYFFADFASFPANGSTGVLYVDKDTGFIYSWNGATFLASGTGGLNYLGTWDANANSPAITSGVGSAGDYYIVGTPGTTNIDGISSWDIGDWIIFGGTAWQKIDNSETTGYVTSVSGTAPISSSGSTTPTISISKANGSTDGYLSSTDWSTFNGKQNAITLTTTGTSGAATLVGSTLNVPNYTTSSGIFGIANTSGVYTFYATLTLAMAAATAGQTIEMFADVTESSVTSITLKNGVNINGNGHTYNYTAATGNCFIDNGVAVVCNIQNLNIVRTNYTSGSVYVQTSTNSDTDWTGSKIYSTQGSSYGIQLVGTIRNCWIKITGNGTAIYSAYSSNAKIYGSYGESTGNGTGLDCRTSTIYNSTGISNSGFGGYLDQSKGYNCILQSTSNYGCQYGQLFSSTIVSISSTSVWIVTCTNCTIISTSGSCVASQNNYFYNCTMITSSGNCTNFQSFNYNCVFRTDSNTINTALNNPEFYNCSIQTNWNNASGHALIQPGPVVNCYIAVGNTSANCLYNSAAQSLKYANNTFKGATTPVNANITQSIVNTQDNQGNILL